MNKLLITALSLINLCSNAYGMDHQSAQAANAAANVVMADVKIATEESHDGASRPAKRLRTLSGAAVAIATLKTGEDDAWLAGEESNTEARKRKIRNAIQQAPLSLRERKKALYAKINVDRDRAAYAKEFEEFVDLNGTDKLDRIEQTDLDTDDTDGDVKMAHEDNDPDATETESDNDEAYAKEYEEYVERYGTNELDQLCHDPDSFEYNGYIVRPSRLSNGEIERYKVDYKVYLCPVKDCKYTSPFIKTHIDSHENIKKWKCEICQAKFAQNGNLKKHMLKRHGEGSGNFQCKECGKKCATHRGLNGHTSRAHNNPFVLCKHPGCNVQVRKYSLHLHMLIHSHK